MASARATVLTFRAAICACETGQQPERMLDLLAETQGLGFETDVTIYSAAVSVRGKGNNLVEHLGC